MSALLLQALAAGSSGQGALYVDDVFSTYLRTGTGADTTVTTGIDMTKGYMLWSKGRSGATEHAVYDSARGVTLDLITNSTAAQTTQAAGLKAVSSTGHTIGSLAKMNTSGATYVDWVFRKAPKFFDVVTYTGNGVAGWQIPHGLGVAPGMVIVKRVDALSQWRIGHRSIPGMYTDFGGGAAFSGTLFDNYTSTSVSVYVAPDGSSNTLGALYVAYLFAHDPSAEGIVQCGSYTGNGSVTGPVVTLGWEPQYLMIKNASGTSNWQIIDSMRGMPVGSTDATLQANLSNAESSLDCVSPTATGFQVTSTSSEVNTSGSAYIYMAIRRPNKPPTSGTEVYKPLLKTGNGATQYQYPGFQPDTYWGMIRDAYSSYSGLQDVLRGGNVLRTSNTDTGIATVVKIGSVATGRVDFSNSDWNVGGSPMVDHFFRRAPGFFDVVCDTGTGAAHAIAHTLTKSPELIIRKSRSAATQWEVWHSALAATEKLVLNSDAAKATDATAWGSTLPTATQFTVGTGSNVNANAATFVTYLFATLAGISKVGSYTGNSSSQTIDCGFSTGARFVLIKRTDATGDWYVWDSVRGIIAANDPHLSLNTTAAEVTTDDSIDPASVGFIVNQNAATNVNVNGGSYIFLAIA